MRFFAYIICKIDGNPLDSELHVNIPLFTLLTSASHDNGEGILLYGMLEIGMTMSYQKMMRRRFNTVRKFIDGFNEENRLFEGELIQLSQNLNGNWDQGDHSEGYAS